MEKLLPDEVLSLIYRYLRPDKPSPSAVVLKKFMQQEILSAEDFVEDLVDTVFVLLWERKEPFNTYNDGECWEDEWWEE